jgi:hypothetical protein
VLETVQVRGRATAFALKRRILEHYLPAATVTFPRDLLPRGGATECWSARAGDTDLADAAAALAR